VWADPLCKKGTFKKAKGKDKVEKVLGCKIPWNKTCGKTTTEME
jgi:hypothetical protein